MNSKIVRRIEEQVTRELILTANDAGFICIGYDLGDGLKKCTDYETIVQACLSADDVYLVFQSPSHKKKPWVYLVFGNDGWDSINNWYDAEGFEDLVMSKVNDYCENIDKHLFKA